MKISKYQFDDNAIKEITFDDYHEAIEDAISIYTFENKKYIVINISSLKEDDNKETYVVCNYEGPFKQLSLIKDIRIVENVLNLFELDEN